MAHWLISIAFALLMLTRPDGHVVYIAPSSVVAVLCLCGVGRAPTVVVTLSGNYYVKEPAAEVAKRVDEANGK